jgi:translation initiation factor 2B subunit (eIF-2B alpha/beta/delta family)
VTRLLEYYEKLFYLSEDHAQQICRIAARVEKMWEGYSSIPYFTTHGPLHNETIIDLLLKLIPDSMKSPSCELERYLLLAGAWLHDVGMLDLDFFREQYRPATVRAQHHERSARWLVCYAAELGLCAAEADIIAHLVKMHRKKESLEHCPEQMFVGSQKVRARLAAALLRLADALHIDETRAPLKEYSLYRMTGMPAEAKFHWVKARAVQGIDLNLIQGLIKVQIGVPENSSEGEFRPLADFIRQEIESEVETVRHALASEGCPLFTDVMVEMIQVPGLERGSNRANEVDELNNLISIDVSPNARRLATVILQSIEQIGPMAQPLTTAKHVLDTLQNLRDYAKDLVPKVVARRCHIAAMRAFVALVLLLKGKKPAFEWYTTLSLFALLPNTPRVKEEMERSLTAVIEQITFPSDDDECRAILQRIYKYFVWQQQLLDKVVSNLKQKVKEKGASILRKSDRILLYGTSASVIDLLETVSNPEMKEHLEIFVAECRVKSNYATTNKIIYNDGIEYARRIAQKGYKKVAIVPDAAIAHLLLPKSYYEQAIEATVSKHIADEEEREHRETDWLARSDPITKVFFGFNGLNLKHEFAVHSCGHLALTLLAKEISNSTEEKVYVYLVGTSNKCGMVHYKHVEPRSVKTWLLGDTKLLEEHGISDYNPIDDIIKLDLVDYVISDLGILPPDKFFEEFERFLEESKEQFEISLNSF